MIQEHEVLILKSHTFFTSTLQLIVSIKEIQFFSFNTVLSCLFQSTSYHVANLHPHTPYFFRVTAKNKHGYGKPSERSSVIVTKDRRSSLRLSIDSDGKKTISLHWFFFNAFALFVYIVNFHWILMINGKIVPAESLRQWLD